MDRLILVCAACGNEICANSESSCSLSKSKLMMPESRYKEINGREPPGVTAEEISIEYDAGAFNLMRRALGMDCKKTAGRINNFVITKNSHLYGPIIQLCDVGLIQHVKSGVHGRFSITELGALSVGLHKAGLKRAGFKVPKHKLFNPWGG